MLRTACIVAFYGFLRCGEFTVSKASQFDPHINLCIEDVVFHSDLVVLKLKQSKTDPFRKGINIQLHKLGQLICPYTILLEYIQIRKEFSPTNQTDPLFITIDKKPLERQYFITCIKKVLDICGFNSSHYNGHSFRIGAATSAGKAKIEDHLIKTLGRWTSDSYIRYIRVTPASIKTAQSTVLFNISGIGNTDPFRIIKDANGCINATKDRSGFGIVSVKKEIDYERVKDTYTFEIQCQVASYTVILKVENIIEENLSFSNVVYNVSVKEDTIPSSVILRNIEVRLGDPGNNGLNLIRFKVENPYVSIGAIQLL
ncbi:unnamed protein product [Mytilus edulis]|uniref:Tyr recombinase domain-containing protein n=1 Tax=Mytilus edulis TaxID=6550 RepID=A0A8S3UI92_MYTED|nr:unnamed protein product [Mytilus edulis]